MYVSDEEDQSTEKVEHYVDYLKAVKGTNKGLVKAYSIVTTELTGNKWETIGNRYKYASMLTGGKTASIKDNFFTILEDLGEDIVALLDSFALAGTPASNNIRVEVNGVEVSTGWTWNATNRTIKFLDGHVPADGSKIEVFYTL